MDIKGLGSEGIGKLEVHMGDGIGPRKVCGGVCKQRRHQKIERVQCLFYH